MSHSDNSMIRGFVRRAIQTQAPLLAASLHWYAEAEALSWEELARSLGCSADALDQVALCQPPRDESFVADVEAIAGGYVDPARLLPLLRRLQVLGTLEVAPAQASQPAAAATPLFLAARLREEPEGYAAELPEEGTTPEDTTEEPGSDAETLGDRGDGDA